MSSQAKYLFCSQEVVMLQMKIRSFQGVDKVIKFDQNGPIAGTHVQMMTYGTYDTICHAAGTL